MNTCCYQGYHLDKKIETFLTINFWKKIIKKDKANS